MIVVTGAAGFIGACLVKQLNEQGQFNIIAVDNFGETTKWKNLLKVSFRDFIHKDDLLKKFTKIGNITTVYHLGASNLANCNEGDYMLRNNYEYTKYLCKLSIKQGVKFVYASSADTYGAGEQGYDDEEIGLVNLKPLDLYGYSKHMFDLFAQRNDIFNKYGVVGLKYFHVYGPLEDHKGENSSAVLKSYLSYLKNDKVELFKSDSDKIIDGEQKTDFIYVKDAVKMTYMLANHDKSKGIYNLGTGKARSFNDLVAALSKALDKQIKIDYVKMPDNMKNNYQNFMQANIAKFKNFLSPDFFTATSLEDGVRDYVKYLKDGEFSINK